MCCSQNCDACICEAVGWKFCTSNFVYNFVYIIHKYRELMQPNKQTNTKIEREKKPREWRRVSEWLFSFFFSLCFWLLLLLFSFSDQINDEMIINLRNRHNFVSSQQALFYTNTHILSFFRLLLLLMLLLLRKFTVVVV